MSAQTFTKQEKKILTLASLGGMFEFYDFIIYGVFSVYFAHQFFPHHNTWIVIMQSYLVFILGYLARPVGGIIFSHIGDEYGRKKVLIITIILMGLASLGIGFLPTYSQIGILSPIILSILRLLQGLALGGELPSTYVYVSESLRHKRGVAFGIVMTGVNFGILLGMLINTLLTFFLTDNQLFNFGWRIPFIMGGLLCIVSYKIRKTLHETAVFTKIHDKPKVPIIYLLKHHFLELMTGIALVALMAGLVVVVAIFMPTYLEEVLKLNPHFISFAMNLMMIFNLSSIFITGFIVQKYNPFLVFKWLLLLGSGCIILSYILIQQNHILPGLIILGGVEGVAAMLTPYLLTTLFDAKIHLTGVALSYNIALTVFGGLSPLIITDLIKRGFNIYLIPAIYLLCMIIVSGIGLVYSKKNRINKNGL